MKSTSPILSPAGLARHGFACLALAGAVLLAMLSTPVAAAKEVAAMHALFEREWQREMAENPLTASFLGEMKYNSLWPDIGLEAQLASHEADRKALAALMEIDRRALPAAEQVNYDLFRHELENRIARYRYRDFLLPINQRNGIQTADRIAELLPFTTEQHYRDWITRLENFGRYMDRTIELLATGIKEGRTQAHAVMQRVPRQIEAQIVTVPEQSPWYAPLRAIPEGIPQRTVGKLRKQARQAIKNSVIPAYQRLLDFMTNRYLPATRSEVGVHALPEGRDYYAFLARFFTTTDLTPDAIHEIGLREVARIRSEMEKIIAQVKFDGSFAEFLDYLRTDPQFYYQTPEELLQAYRAISKRLDPELVHLFGKLPRMPYGVRPIADSIAPDTTTAYYSRPAADGSRPGWYYVNLYRPEVRPKYEMEVLSVHEAVPGHHLQIALAMELGELPNFRRYGGFTAFVEGWGLYSESLGEEMGLYQDPYSKFGQLTYDMWRAVRLVVDTGMHYKGWTRTRAIEYFKANAAKTEHDIVNEIDRYISFPGQALAYKIGQLRIKALRKEASERLGERFDIRDFHDVVLGAGAVTLDVLSANVRAYIDRNLQD